MARCLRLVAAVSLAATAAQAEPVASVVEPAPGEPSTAKPPTAPAARDVAHAPLPGQESGRTDPIPSDDTAARRIGRDLLWFPKIVMNGALTPIRASLYAFERYSLAERYYRIFFNDARTIGLYPTGTFESGFGLAGVVLGARFVHRDLFGDHEHLSIAAAAGVDARFRQLYAANYRTRHTEVDLGYEVRPRDPFYGIGNDGDAAMQTRFGQQRARLRLTGDARVWRELHLRPAASVMSRSFGDPASGTPTSEVYDTQTLVGWSGYDAAYAELEVRWDSRGAVTMYEPAETYATGTLAGAFGGVFHPLTANAGSDFARYGADLQQFVRLGAGPRVIAARLHGEAVSAPLDEVPFMELPALGGPLYLRGYDVDQLRDRIAAFATLEYSWDLGSVLAANAFVDAGRVWRDYRALTFDDLRVGYGVGLELRWAGGFVAELALASSIDGGLYTNLSFNPVYSIDERVRRR